MAIFNRLRSFLQKNKTPPPVTNDASQEATAAESPFIWCLIGNVIDEHYEGVEKQIVHGTKHFSPGTKVYCFPIQRNDGYDNMRAIGRHRKTTRYVCMIIPTKYIGNWRLQKVYRPYILNVMKSQFGWTNSEEDKARMILMLTWLPERTAKMDS